MPRFSVTVQKHALDGAVAASDRGDRGRARALSLDSSAYTKILEQGQERGGEKS